MPRFNLDFWIQVGEGFELKHPSFGETHVDVGEFFGDGSAHMHIHIYIYT